jgi:DNA-binding transcriptional LysR family regulator
MPSLILLSRLPTVLAWGQPHNLDTGEARIREGVSERFVRLIQEDVDMAIRIGDLADSSLVARQLGTVETVVVAAPVYLERNGVPDTVPA